ncbi:nitrogen fixation protein fixH [Roseococcus sp. SYP-B2431]|uniref:FixH family protein n=1 Tax=Roseococcus sp. SYP-B2431 TaxID=2496640 RepID=UPI00103E7BFD|nr:FixH family protein [Roseococcus sp. SYP-B2431]TCH98268.1 nitrogen fixation protein fixH [Roseococcus sp. SYP-B2431]
MTTTMPRGRWIPWVFVGGFGVVVAVNAVLITAAVTTFTGTTTGGAYDRGRTYGDVLAEAERQRALGWQGAVSRQGGAVVLALRQADGSPLPADATVAGRLQRPLERRALPLHFLPAAPGGWRAAVEIPAPGAWEAVLTVTRGADRFELRERLTFP